MKNIMIKKELYDKLKAAKGKKSFSDHISTLFKSNVEQRRKGIRAFFAKNTDKEVREMEKIITEVMKDAKGRLF